MKNQSLFACLTFISLLFVIPGYGQSIEVDDDGRLHIVAVFNSEFALDDTTLTETLADGNTVVAATFDEAGTLLWARPIRKGTSEVNLAVDAMGNTYIGDYTALTRAHAAETAEVEGTHTSNQVRYPGGSWRMASRSQHQSRKAAA